MNKISIFFNKIAIIFLFISHVFVISPVISTEYEFESLEFLSQAKRTPQEDYRSLVVYKPRQPLSGIIKNLYEEIEKKSFILQTIEIKLLSLYKEPLPQSIIILSGVNSAGKSYLAQRLANYDPLTVFISMRAVRIEILCNFLSKRRATEFQKVYSAVGDSFIGLFGANKESPMMKTILNDIKNKEEFLGALDELEKIYDINIFHNINKAMLEKAMPFLCLGRSVVFDPVSYEHDFCIIEELNPVCVLVYCSLPCLIERAQERNFKALMDKDANEDRSYLNLCKTFTKFFRPKKRKERGLGLGNLSKDEFLAKIEEAYELSKFSLHLDFILSFPSFKENLLHSMNFHNTKIIKIYPRNAVDFVLNTSNLFPQESFTYLQHAIKLIRDFSPKVKLTHPLTIKDLPGNPSVPM